jgi:hypothetical protein
VDFERNISATGHIFFREILEKKREYNETVHWFFIESQRAYDSVRMEIVYNVLTEFGILMKLAYVIMKPIAESG